MTATKIEKEAMRLVSLFSKQYALLHIQELELVMKRVGLKDTEEWISLQQIKRQVELLVL